MNEVMTTATQAVATILCALLSLLAAKAVAGINAYTAKMSAEALAIDDAATRNFINDALSRIDILATVTVNCAEQTIAASLRELSKLEPNDKSLRQQLVTLGLQARDTIISNLSEEYKNALIEAGINLEEYVKSVVETKVLALKKENPALAAG